MDYEVAAIVNGMDLDGIGEVGDKTSTGLAGGVNAVGFAAGSLAGMSQR